MNRNHFDVEDSQDFEDSDMDHPEATMSLPLFDQIVRAHPCIESVLECAPLIWAKSNLFERLLGDVLVAVCVTASFTPCLTIVDKAIVQCSAGTHTFAESAIISFYGMAQNPIQYLRGSTFLWMWATYAITYAAANCFKTFSEENLRRRKSSDTKAFSIDPNIMAGIAFVGTTLANTGAAICKDRVYSRMFGTGVTVVPIMAYVLWIMRDLTVIGSAFILPPIVGRYIDERMGKSKKNGGSVSSDMPSSRSLVVAQFIIPISAQVVAGPLHYLALDVCNQPYGISAIDRWIHLRNGLSSVIPARMVRILPAYGLGGVLNQRGRQAWKDYLDTRPLHSIVYAALTRKMAA